MKKQNWVPGLIVSLGVSLIAALPRVIRMERLEFRLVFISIAYNFIFCVCCWLTHRFILSKSRQLNISNRIILTIVIAAIAIATVSGFAFLLDSIFSLVSHHAILLPEIADDKRPYLLLLRSVVISGLFYFIAYYLYMLSEKQRNLLEIATLKQAQLAANLSSLKEQLSPHFLFNTLNTLNTLTREQRVKDYVSELANVYRYVLQYKDSDTATLQQELHFMDSYLYILKTRLEDAIQIEINVNQQLLNRKMPPLTLQLLLENAVKHNVASLSRPLKIEIRTHGDEFLAVINNLQPKTSVQYNTGIGLDNVAQRYRILFDKAISIEKTEATFTVKLPLV
ncbi:MAG TPA: histidine kinase [Flavipsychrobacter sp.]|nr:histidine kinase [Flavipsychrobacter sp.]